VHFKQPRTFSVSDIALLEKVAATPAESLSGKTMRDVGLPESLVGTVVPERSPQGGVESLLLIARSHGHAMRAEQLTEREREILRLLAAGWTNREIGAELGLTVGTVKNHVARILEKLDVSDRTQAAVRGVELGLAKPTT
jgi:DNA-binding NarL/FixJ family response regulator